MRIGKAEHARILRLVDVEQRKVADVAAEYGCSTANIYVLLGRLRRANAAGNRAAGTGGGEAVAAPRQDAPAAPVVAPPPQAAAAALFGVTRQPLRPPRRVLRPHRSGRLPHRFAPKI